MDKTVFESLADTKNPYREGKKMNKPLEKTQITVTVDKANTEVAEEMLRYLGLDLSSAINVFLNMCVNTGGLPFDVKQQKLNDKTAKAIEDSALGTAEIYGPFNTIGALMESLNA